MPHPKMKNENYQNLGGIDTKVSPYITGPMEFLNLINYDFQTPGSLTERWGSTQYVGQTGPGSINSLYEYIQLSGASSVVFSYSGGIFYGATTGQSQGMSFSVMGATQGLNCYEVDVFSAPPTLGAFPLGANGIVNLNYEGGSSLRIGNGATVPIKQVTDPQIQSDNTLSYQTFQNLLFGADGNKFFKFDGTTTYPVGLPPISFIGTGITSTGVSSYFSNLSGASDFLGFGLTGAYYFYASYVNNQGFEGPIWPFAYLPGGSLIVGTTAAANGGTFAAIRYLFNTPLQFGISSINVYSFWSGATIFSLGQDPSFWLQPFTLLNTIPASGSSTTWAVLGTTTGGQTLVQGNLGAQPNPLSNEYSPIGLTFQITGGYIYEVDLINYYPKFLEVFQNRLMLAGFSATPSTVWFSDAGEPEGYEPSFNFEVRTNDGDYVTAIKTYLMRFYVFKQRSFHVLTGDNPNNFFLQQVSDQYGAINNRCVVTFDNTLLFLDRKGVISWNGAQVSQLSTPKVQSYFDSMNYSAALNVACMVHDKIRNQVLVAIPINGSTTNNITLVYDYMVGAWTTYTGFTPSAFALVQGYTNNKYTFYGDAQGRVNWFGPSFLADNGVGFTTYIKSRFLKDMGESTQKQFRRFYLNADSPGTTIGFALNFYQDYGPSIVLSTTLTLAAFQNRIDFGISAKSLAFEMSNIQTSTRLKIHGFAFESRYLRSS